MLKIACRLMLTEPNDLEMTVDGEMVGRQQVPVGTELVRHAAPLLTSSCKRERRPDGFCHGRETGDDSRLMSRTALLSPWAASNLAKSPSSRALPAVGRFTFDD